MGNNTVKAPDRVPKRLYTIKEAAIYLGRSVGNMRALIWGRVIPRVKSEGNAKIFIDLRDLEEFVTKNKAFHS